MPLLFPFTQRTNSCTAICLQNKQFDIKYSGSDTLADIHGRIHKNMLPKYNELLNNMFCCFTFLFLVKQKFHNSQ